MIDLTGDWLIVQTDATGRESIIASVWDDGDARAMLQSVRRIRPWNTYRIEEGQ